MSKYKYVKVPIKGMHCRSCEILIEDKLKEIDHVKSVDISYKTGEALVHYDSSSAPLSQIHQAISDTGYFIGSDSDLPFFTRDKKEYTSLGVAFLFIVALYLILDAFGLMNISLSSDLSEPGWGLIIIVGLVAGFSTCMALVGGLSLGLSTKFAENHPQATASEKFVPHIFFVLGRILSYAFLGGLLGMIGAVFQLSTIANGIITLLVALVMLIMGLQLINIFPRLSKFKLTLPKSIGRAFGISTKSKEYTHNQAMILGAFTFFLPCGFTQAMQLYAISTGSFGFGALVMGLFALGTAPGLLSIGGISSILSGSFKEKFFKAAGVVVILFAVFNLNNAYTLVSLSLGDLSFNIPKKEKVVSDPNVSLENGFQVVRMTENNNGYSPNKFSIKKGVPVKWIVDAKAPYSCASVLLIPKLKIQKFLEAGENIIEFTPTESGALPFSCSMGMYTGVFNVYDDSDSVSEPTSKVINTAKAAAKTGGDTCGGSGGSGGCGCGGGAKVKTETVAAPTSIEDNIQVIKTTYTADDYLSPNTFTVKAGKKVRLMIDVRDSGYGCGYAIMIPDLYNKAIPLEAGRLITMEFTPNTKGTYDITCSMDMIRFGTIIVE